MKLLIAEKPSVALTIGKVIGATKKAQGYYYGNDYVVSWCYGHLVQLAEPNEYDDKYKKWSIKDLPIIPKEYKYVSSGNKQLNVLKKMFNQKNIDYIINACDAGREGELIFRLVYNMSNSKIPIKRLWISSMEDKAIKNGIENLKNGEYYENLYESAVARSIADWLVGMNMSRLYSCRYKDNISIGRVQTPTLAMIVERDLKIDNFVKEPYYNIKLELDKFSLLSEKITNVNIAKEKSQKIPNEIIINDVQVSRKVVKPDKLYDLTTLQREANKIYSYSAKETLDIAQSLYEKKLITYPRTDSNYLTEDMKDSIFELVKKLEPNLSYSGENFGKIFNNKKVTDHYAIIPTEKAININLTDDRENKILKLIRNRLLMASSLDKIEEHTKIIAKISDMIFSTSGKVIIDKGFEMYSEKTDTKDTILPKVNIGDKYKVNNKVILKQYTSPPSRYTEDTLLKAMEVAGNSYIDKNIEVERKGLGTTATRAGIIENIIARGYVRRDKKKLISTEKGQKLISIVEQQYKDPKTTAEWEMKLTDIANGKFDKKKFLNEIENEISASIIRVRNNE